MVKRLLVLLFGVILTTPTIFLITRKENNPFHFEGILLNESTPFVFNTSSLQPNDYNLLIDLDFHFIILNEVCKESAPFLLILIHSSAKNTEKRDTIRETWGLNDHQVKTLFLIGQSNSTMVKEKVVEENSRFKDIIQGSFVENYYNLSYKHGMALKYVVYHCPQAKFILRADDDIFVNTPALVTFLRHNLSPHGALRCLMCNLNRQAKVIRSYRSKWRVSFEEYSEKYYPTYCEGWHVVYSPDVVFRLYRELQKHRYFSIDDVLVTGLLARKIDYANHTDSSSLTYLSHLMSVPKWFLFGGREFNDEERRMLWNKFSRKEG